MRRILYNLFGYIKLETTVIIYEYTRNTIPSF